MGTQTNKARNLKVHHFFRLNVLPQIDAEGRNIYHGKIYHD